MKKQGLRVLAVCLALCLVLSGCAGVDFGGYFEQLGALLSGALLTPFSQMEYVRPDMEQFNRVLQESCDKAAKETNLQKMVTVIYDFYAVFDDFYTNLALAMVHYSLDQTDTYWASEYQFCTQNSGTVDGALDRFYRVLAASPLREQLEGENYFGAGYFDSYEGESIYDEYFTQLMQQEAALENEYYSLIAQAGADFGYTQSFYDTYGAQMAGIFVELVKNRQAQAEYAGYESYPQFAYDFFHVRDYTVEQATAYLADIRAQLVPLYRQLGLGSSDVLYSCTEQEAFSYVKELSQMLGGEITTAFSAMEKAGLYDIAASENKLDASFEVYIRNYGAPFVFVNSTGTEYDKLTFAHEFGHFCKDFVAGGGTVGVDVAEIFSQGMEYLSLCHGQADEHLTRLKLLDSLSIYVVQAAYASFEQQVYSLEGDALTAENVEALYSQVCENYGMAGGWSYVLVTHFFTEPMYVISYVVSNDAALQLYQLEQESVGSGLTCYKQNLGSVQPYFLAFLQEAGLESPFADGRIEQVKETLQSILVR